MATPFVAAPACTKIFIRITVLNLNIERECSISLHSYVLKSLDAPKYVLSLS